MLEAIRNGKHVVTANKALLATHGNEIFKAAQKKGVMVAFEASVAGGIPIIKALREGLAANRIEWIAGIINGTSNFILSEMRDKGLPFAVALKDAQRKGYAEADPTFDIEGVDAAHKLTILSAIAFGIPMQFPKAYTEGISKLTQEDIRYAEQLGYRIKLLGITKRTGKGIELRVHPTLIPARRLIANVEGVMNAILVKGDAVGATMYYGAGAGSQPTASAVVADLVDVTRLITADPEQRVPHLAFQPDRLAKDPILPIGEVETSYYLRMRVKDRPGVLADVTRILADSRISIDAMVQKEPGEGEQPRRHRDAHAPRDREERQRRDGENREAADRGRQGHAHPPRRAAVMKYVSTRAGRKWRRRGASPRSCSKAWPPTAASTCPRHFRGLDSAESEEQELSASSRKRSFRSSWTTFPAWTRIVDKTYTKEIFGSEDITPLKTLEPGLHILGLSNGPTLAFKDVALQLLGNLFEDDASTKTNKHSTFSAPPRATPARPPNTRCAARRTSTSSCSRRTAA